MKKYIWSTPILFGMIAFAACTQRQLSNITAITVTASQVALRELGSSQLQANVFGTGDFDPAVIWSLEPSGFGSLSSGSGGNVLYKAPLNTAGGVVRITARSVEAEKRQQTVYISVNPRQTSIAAGSTHTLALKSDGTMLSWGWDANGQLGNDVALEAKATPVAVNPISNVVAVAAGGRHSLALKSDGIVYAWGADFAGQLGNDVALEENPIPVSVLLGANLIRVP